MFPNTGLYIILVTVTLIGSYIGQSPQTTYVQQHVVMGTVIIKGGKPLANIEVSVWKVSGSEPRDDCSPVRTNNDGKFILAIPPSVRNFKLAVVDKSKRYWAKSYTPPEFDSNPLDLGLIELKPISYALTARERQQIEELRVGFSKSQPEVADLLESTISEYSSQYSQALSLGRSMLYTVPTAQITLNEATPLSTGLRSGAYLFEVGGVAFDSVAKLDWDSAASVTLRYAPENPDGKRLLVNTDGKWITAPIYDWQMMPIARYADSKYTACFSLFGDPEDLRSTQAANIVKEQDGRVFKFHPALKNTLVGLRLMQLDMLIISDDAVDLPKLDGRYILGTGEVPPNIVANKRAAAYVRREIGQFDLNDEPAFDSYVINDRNVDIHFSIARGALVPEGSPTYFTFKRDQRNGQPIPNKALNRWISENLQHVRAINPAVWDTAVTVARYAAFFRSVKANNPEAWRLFLTQISMVHISPSLKTPDVIVYPREREAVDDVRRLLERHSKSPDTPVQK